MRYFCPFLIILLSCGQATENSSSEMSSKSSIKEQIIESYRQTHIVFNDKLQRNDTLYFDAGTIHATSDFTGDGILDFFVIEEYLGGPTTGHVHNGKTGAEISLDPGYEVIVSRPGIDIQAIIVDVNVGDDKSELMVLCGGGGTIENRHYMTIYQYDRVKKKMKLIFTENISLFTWDDNLDEHLVEVNHISPLTSPYPIDNEIVVSKGKFRDTIEPYNLNIVRPLIGPSKKYTYDPKQKRFIQTSETTIK